MAAQSQVPSVELPPRLGLVTTIQNRDASFDRDSRLVNAFAEHDPTIEDYWITKRPGLTSHSTIGGVGLGIYNWNGVIYSIFGTTLYKNGAVFGTVDATGGVYMWEQILGTGWLVLNNGVRAYYTDGAALTEIARFLPALAGAFAIGSTYVIVSSGNTNFVALGAANNNPGTVFTATGIGDPLTTGTAAVRAGSFLVGVTYEIYQVGSTDFTAIGASSNNPGVVFTATGVGSGSGSAFLPNFPTAHVKGWAYLDGTLYVMNANGQIFGTSTNRYGGIGGLDDPRVWDPLNLIVARIRHGQGVALARHLSYVVAFKNTSTEFFYDAANTEGSPLGPVQGAYSVHGCISADTIQNIEEKLLWVTTSSTPSAPQVALLDDIKVQIVSTEPIERLLRTADFDSVMSWSFEHSGHKFYGITLKNSNITLVYDLDQNLWYQWTDGNEDYWPIAAHASGSSLQASLVQHESNGKIYRVGADYIYPNDDGVLFPVDIYTPNFDGGTRRRKHLSAMFFNADQKAGSKLSVRVSDDDYQTWTNFREVDLSKRRPTLLNCGTFTRRAWHIRHRANTPLRLNSVDLQLDLGTL